MTDGIDTSLSVFKMFIETAEGTMIVFFSRPKLIKCLQTKLSIFYAVRRNFRY